MRIWLPDDEVGITVDTSQNDDERVTLFAQRFTMTMQQLKVERGFAPTEKEKD